MDAWMDGGNGCFQQYVPRTLVDTPQGAPKGCPVPTHGCFACLQGQQCGIAELCPVQVFWPHPLPLSPQEVREVMLHWLESSF